MAGGILLVVCGRLEVWVKPNHLSDERVTLFLNLFSCAIFACVQPLPFTVVDWLWRGGPKNGRQKRTEASLIPFLKCCFVISDMLHELPKANQTIFILKREQVKEFP